MNGIAVSVFGMNAVLLESVGFLYRSPMSDGYYVMSLNVLLIEDEPDVQQLVRAILEPRGYTVITAANGAEGVKLATEHEPDLIICDVMMRYLNGFQVLQQLAQLNIVPFTPFIFLTALDSNSDRRQGMVLGADDYVVKPFARQELIETIETILKRRELLAEAVPQRQVFDIFVSYSHLDQELLPLICDHLENAGLRVWTDELIEPADDWEEAVAQTIKNAGCLVALLTENSAQSEWVRRELGFAEANQTRIFPLLLRGTEQDSIPFRLINHQFIDARLSIEEAMQRLVDVIQEHLNILGE